MYTGRQTANRCGVIGGREARRQRLQITGRGELEEHKIDDRAAAANGDEVVPLETEVRIGLAREIASQIVSRAALDLRDLICVNCRFWKLHPKR
jgi:hypothetical protein